MLRFYVTAGYTYISNPKIYAFIQGSTQHSFFWKFNICSFEWIVKICNSKSYLKDVTNDSADM